MFSWWLGSWLLICCLHAFPIFIASYYQCRLPFLRVLSPATFIVQALPTWNYGIWKLAHHHQGDFESEPQVPYLRAWFPYYPVLRSSRWHWLSHLRKESPWRKLCNFKKEVHKPFRDTCPVVNCMSYMLVFTKITYHFGGGGHIFSKAYSQTPLSSKVNNPCSKMWKKKKPHQF